MKECAEKCVQHKVECPFKECRLWIDYPDDLNCTSIAVKKNGRMTLRKVSERLGISFVRVKQIQDRTLAKAAKKKQFLSFFEK